MKSNIIGFTLLTIVSVSANATAIEMPELAKTSGCTSCHAIDKKIIGPSWMDVSKFYNGKMEKSSSGKDVKQATEGQPVEHFLMQKISKGGHGNWGEYAMVANDNVYNQQTPARQKKIKELVDFILALAK
jgi:cytochrome c551/c552